MAGERLFSTSEIQTVLQGFNPWWVSNTVRAEPFRRTAFEICWRYLNDSSLRRALLLCGPRRVGKTTILNQIAQALLAADHEPRGILYVSLDHPLLKLLNLKEILELYHETFHPIGKPCVLLLDEAQFSRDWELHLKQLIDHRPEYRIVTTGSASVSLINQTKESGVGRWLTIPIPTLSFYEFLHLRGEAPANVSAELRPSDLLSVSPATRLALRATLQPSVPSFMRYLLVGGFPETAKMPDLSLCQKLLREDVVDRVLKRDMTVLFGIRNVDDLERLFLYLCLHSGGVFNVKTSASALQVNSATINNHIRALEAAYLIYRLPPAEVGGKKVLKARYKIYLSDAALRNAVLLKGEDILRDPNQMGTIVETSVLRHLFAYHYRETPRVSYWRDVVTEREVDILVELPKHTIAVEVKYQTNAAVDTNSGLAALASATPLTSAFLVSREQADFDVKTIPGTRTQVAIVPAHIFCYLLGQAERLLWQ